MTSDLAPHLFRKPHRRRRKKQTTFLSSQMRIVIQEFSNDVGCPTFDESKGCRNFLEWLTHLSHPRFRSSWRIVTEAAGRELFHHMETRFLQEETIREVIKCVVKPRQNESGKLVCRSAHRHATELRSGNSLFSVFQRHMKAPADFFITTSDCDSCVTPLTDPAICTKPVDAVHEQVSPSTAKPPRLDEGFDDSVASRLPSFHELISSLD